MGAIFQGIGKLLGGDTGALGPTYQGNFPSVPQYTDPAIQAAATAQATAAANAKGRASTILTSGQGDTSTATVQKKGLLGVG